jgi:toxin YoeB
MNIKFTSHAWQDYIYWQKSDRAMIKKINDLIKDVCRNPFEGKGKPEPLKYDLAGCWSRRINGEHRLIYQVENDEVIIIGCRYHYD